MTVAFIFIVQYEEKYASKNISGVINTNLVVSDFYKYINKHLLDFNEILVVLNC